MNLGKEIVYTKQKAPIKKDDVIGKVTYKYDGIEYSTELIAKKEVEESKIFNYVLYGLAVGFIIVIIYIMIKGKKKAKSYRISY